MSVLYLFGEVFRLDCPSLGFAQAAQNLAKLYRKIKNFNSRLSDLRFLMHYLLFNSITEITSIKKEKRNITIQSQNNMCLETKVA